MGISVVMATYNRRDLLDRVLRPLLDDPATDELVVVVDGYDDGSIEYLRELAQSEPRLRPIWIENSGAVKAQQTGVEAATGEVVLVIDDDVLADPGLVSGHARHHEQADDPGLVVVGYMPTPKPEKRGPGSFTSFLYHDVYEYRCASWEEGAPVLRGLWGGNVSLNREALLAADGIGGRYVLPYHYDWELGLRLQRCGLYGRFDRALSATHLHSRSYEAFRRECRAQGRAFWLIDHMHRAVITEDQIQKRFDDRRPLLRWFLVATDRPRIYKVGTTVIDAAVRAAGKLNLTVTERRLASLLGHVERRRGEYEGSVVYGHPVRWEPPFTVPARGDRAPSV
ncbi:glycosyltransferase family 2 protein [Solirubrobacter sp. CPCC 204708]|uniref:Glycosyltransferase n=1 Tax=Solirubrobacter deserti TaxID=2282478 RepID=A0ABT4RME9_9ACTN|nr:glycosyltransferase family 2 protein [Solirubrobacter deserti]MBE2317976.1 glycosyltransferase family 2 protein [Solirubrobacter deserti]MDA0139655.1 glycosyltransferase [Solirubrobacter deserti]